MLSKSTVFKFFINLHIYGGLFCSLYLAVAALSVLNFQHHFISEEPKDTITTLHQIQFDSSLDDDSLARFVANQLEIVGHIPPWDMSSDSSGKFRFKIQRPARTFVVKLNRGSDEVQVKEINYHAGRILRMMHYGSISELDDPVLKAWSWFAKISTIVAFLVVCISVYFWFRKSVKNRVQAVMVVSSGIFSIIFILYVWLVG